MTRDDIIARLRKVAALAAQGVDGEADNSARLLDRIAAEHGIDLSELDGEQIRSHTFRTGREVWRRNLICQILWRTDGNIRCWEAYVPPAGTPRKPDHGRRKGKATRRVVPVAFNAIRTECTDSQFVECTAKFEILQRDYARQQKAFYRAFLLRNDLLCERGPDDPPSSQEQNKLAIDACRLAKGMFESQLRRQIRG